MTKANIFLTRFDADPVSTYVAEVRAGGNTQTFDSIGLDKVGMFIELSHKVAPHVYGYDFEIVPGIHRGSEPIDPKDMGHFEKAVNYAIEDLDYEKRPMRRCEPVGIDQFDHL